MTMTMTALGHHTVPVGGGVIRHGKQQYIEDMKGEVVEYGMYRMGEVVLAYADRRSIYYR